MVFEKRSFKCIYVTETGRREHIPPPTDSPGVKRKVNEIESDIDGPINTENGVQASPKKQRLLSASVAPPINYNGPPYDASRTEVENDTSVESAARSLQQFSQRADDSGAPLMSRGSTHSGDEEAVVYSQTRMLQDPTGRLLYIGDSGTLSYLQLIRMMVENVSGPSQFTTDPRRHKIVESNLVLPPSFRPTHLLPDQVTAKILADAFFVNTNGMAQVFERESFMREVDMCYNNPLSIGHQWLCLLNLVLSYSSTNGMTRRC
jgi:hypothetical protein